MTFNCYNTKGIRIIAKKVNGGYQLIKFNINESPNFTDKTCHKITLRGEFLRGGYIFTNLKKMYFYVNQYRKHTLRDFSGVKQPYPLKNRQATKLEMREFKKNRERHIEMFGGRGHNI